MESIRKAVLPIFLSIIGFFLYQYAEKIDKMSDKLDVVAENTQYMKAKIETIEKRQDRIETKGSNAKNESNNHSNKEIAQMNTVHYYKHEPTFEVALVK